MTRGSAGQPGPDAGCCGEIVGHQDPVGEGAATGTVGGGRRGQKVDGDNRVLVLAQHGPQMLGVAGNVPSFAPAGSPSSVA